MQTFLIIWHLLNGKTQCIMVVKSPLTLNRLFFQSRFYTNDIIQLSISVCRIFIYLMTNIRISGRTESSLGLFLILSKNVHFDKVKPVGCWIYRRTIKQRAMSNRFYSWFFMSRENLIDFTWRLRQIQLWTGYMTNVMFSCIVETW